MDGRTLGPGGCSPKGYPPLAHPLQDHPDFQTKQCFIGKVVVLYPFGWGPLYNQPHIHLKNKNSGYLLGPNNRGVKQLGAHNPKGPPTIFPMNVGNVNLPTDPSKLWSQSKSLDTHQLQLTEAFGLVLGTRRMLPREKCHVIWWFFSQNLGKYMKNPKQMIIHDVWFMTYKLKHIYDI